MQNTGRRGGRGGRYRDRLTIEVLEPRTLLVASINETLTYQNIAAGAANAYQFTDVAVRNARVDIYSGQAPAPGTPPPQQALLGSTSTTATGVLSATVPDGGTGLFIQVFAESPQLPSGAVTVELPSSTIANPRYYTFYVQLIGGNVPAGALPAGSVKLDAAGNVIAPDGTTKNVGWTVDGAFAIYDAALASSQFAGTILSGQTNTLIGQSARFAFPVPVRGGTAGMSSTTLIIGVTTGAAFSSPFT